MIVGLSVSACSSGY